MEGKARALREISERESIPLARTAFVGDHRNDVAAAREAGFAIAFNPKTPEIEAASDIVIHGDDLRAVLPHLLSSARPGVVSTMRKEAEEADGEDGGR